MATSLPLHRALVMDEAFAPSDPGQPFSVHVGWVESARQKRILQPARMKPDIPDEAVDS